MVINDKLMTIRTLAFPTIRACLKIWLSLTSNLEPKTICHPHSPVCAGRLACGELFVHRAESSALMAAARADAEIYKGENAYRFLFGSGLAVYGPR